MTIAELYEAFDDVSQFTEIKILCPIASAHYLEEEIKFSGKFNDISEELRQSNVSLFTYDYLQNILTIIT